MVATARLGDYGCAVVSITVPKYIGVMIPAPRLGHSRRIIICGIRVIDVSILLASSRLDHGDICVIAKSVNFGVLTVASLRNFINIVISGHQYFTVVAVTSLDNNALILVIIQVGISVVVITILCNSKNIV